MAFIKGGGAVMPDCRGRPTADRVRTIVFDPVIGPTLMGVINFCSVAYVKIVHQAKLANKHI